MRLNEHVYVLEVKTSHMSLFLTVIKDNSDLVLIDTGFPNNIETIKEAFINEGLNIEDLTEVMFTHQDFDHIGGAKDIKTIAPKCMFTCHHEEKCYINGECLPFKKAKRKVSVQENTDEELNQIYLENKGVYIPIDNTYTNEDFLSIGGGITIYHTPGHTPGHICLYLNHYSILIAGDALNGNDGELEGPNPTYTFDMDEAYASLHKFDNLAINSIVCYHGGIVDKDAKKQLANLLLNK